MHLQIAVHLAELLIPSAEALVRDDRRRGTTADRHYLRVEQLSLQSVELDRIGRTVRLVADDGDGVEIDKNRAADGYVEYLILRSDHYGWHGNVDSKTTNDTDWFTSFDKSINILPFKLS